MSHRKKTLMFRLSIFIFTLVTCFYMLPFIDADYSYYSSTTMINEHLYEVNILHRVLDPIIWTLVTLILLSICMESKMHLLISSLVIPWLSVILVVYLLYFVSPYPAVHLFLTACGYIPLIFYYLGIGLGVLWLLVSVIFFLRKGLLAVPKQKEDQHQV